MDLLEFRVPHVGYSQKLFDLVMYLKPCWHIIRRNWFQVGYDNGGNIKPIIKNYICLCKYYKHHLSMLKQQQQQQNKL